MTRLRTQNHRAFTLIELVLSMALAAGLAAALYRSMSTVWRAKKVAQSAVEPARIGSIAMDIICRDLASVPPPPSSDLTTLTLGGPFQGTHQGGGAGDNDDLLFRTLGRDEPVDVNDPLSEGMRAIEFLVRSEGGDSVLVRRVTRNLLTNVQQAEQEEILCRNVRAFSVQYFDGTTWQTDWDSSQLGDVLPSAVQITIDITVPHENAEPTVQRITRIVPLACAKPSTTTTGG